MDVIKPEPDDVDVKSESDYVIINVKPELDDLI